MSQSKREGSGHGRLELSTDGKRPSHIAFDDFSLSAACAGERGVRKHMEDEDLICLSLKLATQSQLPQFDQAFDAALFAIFDGHGGRQCASFVKEFLPIEIAKQVCHLTEESESDEGDVVMSGGYTEQNVRRILRCAFQNIDARIASEMPNCRDGSVAVVAFLPYRRAEATSPPVFYVATLGDAAAYLARVMTSGDGELHAVPLSEAHKPWVMAEKERICNSGGTVESGRVNGLLEVSRSFGDLSLKKYGVSNVPTLMKFTVEPAQDEMILLGCDGFWSCWTASEAVTKAKDFIRKETRRLQAAGEVGTPSVDLKSICQQLVSYVIEERKAQDNVTVLLIRISQ